MKKRATSTTIDSISLETIDLERLSALFAIMQNGGIELLHLKSNLSDLPAPMRRIHRYSLQSAISKMSLAVGAAEAGLGTLEQLLKEGTVTPKPKRKKRQAKQPKSNVIDFAVERARRQSEGMAS